MNDPPEIGLYTATARLEEALKQGNYLHLCKKTYYVSKLATHKRNEFCSVGPESAIINLGNNLADKTAIQFGKRWPWDSGLRKWVDKTDHFALAGYLDGKFIFRLQILLELILIILL